MAEEITHITAVLEKVAPVVILTIGSIGNCISFAVLIRPTTRRYSTAVFLIALTVVDFIAMYAGLLRILIQGYFETDIRQTSDAVCKLHVFLIYFSTHSSSWVIVAVTLERVISVWLPIKARTWCTPNIAIMVVCSTLLTLASANSHLLFGFSLVTSDNNTTICTPNTAGYMFFVDKFWPWVDMALLFLIPFGVIMIGNVMIIIKIKRSRKLRRENCPYVPRRTQNPESLYFLSVLLVTLNVVFMICVAPIVVFIIGQYFWWPYGDFSLYSEKESAYNQLSWIIVNLLVFLNCAVNFIFYLTCGSKFRQDLKRMCGCKTKARLEQRTLSHSVSSSSVVYHIPIPDILASSTF